MTDSTDRKSNVDRSCLSIPLKIIDSIKFQNVLYKKFILYSTCLLIIIEVKNLNERRGTPQDKYLVLQLPRHPKSFVEYEF